MKRVFVRSRQSKHADAFDIIGTSIEWTAPCAAGHLD
jgi:hypothetical protein